MVHVAGLLAHRVLDEDALPAHERHTEDELRAAVQGSNRGAYEYDQVAAELDAADDDDRDPFEDVNRGRSG